MNAKHFTFNKIEKTEIEIFNAAQKVAASYNEEIIYIEIIIIQNIMEIDFHKEYKAEYIGINTCRSTYPEFEKFQENFRNLLRTKDLL